MKANAKRDRLATIKAWLPIDLIPRGRLHRKYAVYLVAVISVALLVSGVSDIYFSQSELRSQLAALRRDDAINAADKIDEFIVRIEQQVGWLANLPPSDDLSLLRQEAQRLLRQAPAISHVRLLDTSGHEKLFVSRFELDRIASHEDLSSDANFRAAAAGATSYSPIYFRRETEPYMTIALPQSFHDDAGVVMVEVNLKAIWDVVKPIKIGRTGYAYVIDRNGVLIAHPDISLVLRQESMAALPQVREALASHAENDTRNASRQATFGLDRNGAPVLSTFVPVPRLNSIVFVEQAVSEANAPVYTAIMRTIGLMLAGLLLALAVSLTLARRMVNPIEALRRGAREFAGGVLDHRIDVHSGDELEVVADQFNAMAVELRDSYTSLERKIELRTRELEIANQAKTRFLAAASHDLRQPIHALGLLVSSLRGKATSTEVSETIDRAEAAIGVMVELLDSLLDISRLDAGVVQPTLRDCVLATTLQQVTFDFEEETRDRDLEFHVLRSRAVVRTDPTMLARILRNLVSNALRYTERGKILVGCRRRKDQVRIEVWDTGIGIAPAHQDIIFQEFFQVTDAARGGRGGLGLGLSIVKRLAELLRCTISVCSIPGKGSVFSVTVPIGDEAALATLQNMRGLDFGANLDGRSILVIDDDAMVLDAVQRLLRDWGCEVTTARNPEEAEAHQRAVANPIDLIICDYDLQLAENGIDALGRLMATASVPVGVLMTGDTDAEVLRRAKAAGYPLLHKPVRPAKLRSLLSQLLTKQGVDVLMH
jgi:signal transduction histidine kinase/ActR/RegA family two-component response regulator